MKKILLSLALILPLLVSGQTQDSDSLGKRLDL